MNDLDERNGPDPDSSEHGVASNKITSSKPFWIVVVLIFWAFTLWTAFTYAFPAGVDSADGFAGTYVVNGIDNTGVEYAGTVVIVATDTAGTYEVEYIVGPIQSGVGVRTGPTFVVDWEGDDAAGNRVSGAATYTVFDDGHLEGERSVVGSDELGTETLYPEP